MRGIFVTGTGTGVGKTVTCAALLSRFRLLSFVRYWKPIQTGIEDDDDTATVQRLSGCDPARVFDQGVRLPRPLSPHLSARLAGTTLSVQQIVEQSAPLTSGAAIVEGAGGLLVPLNDRELMIDLMHRLSLPVIIVSHSGLGTINHTLLSVEALRARQLAIAGVIMVGERNDENRLAIEHHGRVRVVGLLPQFADVTPGAVQAAARALDPQGLIERCLTIEGAART
jgi:dethiobiotin synthase